MEGVLLGEGWLTLWVFPKIGVPQNGRFIMESPIKRMIWENPYGCNNLMWPFVH